MDKNFYEPAEDTFFFQDALDSEEEFLKALNPSLIVEIGVGSGAILCHIAKLLGKECQYIATDINELACEEALRLAKEKNVMIECIKTDLLSAVQHRINNKIDVLLFNPPYVPSDHKDISTNLVTGIDAAWAGGLKGREVLDRILPSLHTLISRNGIFYLVAIQENNPLEICNILQNQGFTPKVDN